MIRLKLFELVEDFRLLPRPKIDEQNVNVIRGAIAAGTELPPIVIDSKSKRIVDGFHRKRAYEEDFGINYEIEVLSRDYPNEAAMYDDACKLNTRHGRNLSSCDRVYAAERAKKLFHRKIEAIAASLHMTVEDLKKMCSRKSAKTATSRGFEVVPIKRTISHMAGKTLTKKQVEVNASLSGQRPLRELRELSSLIRNGLWDLSNADLMEEGRTFCDLFIKLDTKRKSA